MTPINIIKLLTSGKLERTNMETNGQLDIQLNGDTDQGNISVSIRCMKKSADSIFKVFVISIFDNDGNRIDQKNIYIY
jgi:hypothetical protein